jgi:hypothetical protein
MERTFSCLGLFLALSTHSLVRQTDGPPHLEEVLTLGRSGPVFAMAFSPKGDFLARRLGWKRQAMESHLR